MLAFVIAAAFALGMLIRGGGSSGSEHEGGTGEEVAQASVWTCSMHPQIRQPGPGDCPLCGMDLIPVLDSSDEDSDPRELKLSENARKLADIQTAPVERRFVDAEIRMVGKIDYDETRVKRISAWVPGRLDRLFVDYTGTRVSEGDHLVHLYSPELISAQEELLQAIEAENQLADAGPTTLRGAYATTKAVREKLRLLGLSPEQIAELESRGEISEHITIFAPTSGIVIHKNAVEGNYVQTGTPIYTIAELDQLWLKLDAFEHDLPWVRYGQEVEFETVAWPGEFFKGKITFVDPVLDEKTRTVKVRVNVSNEDGRLKPGMFIKATLHASLSAEGKVYDKGLAGKWISPMHPEIVKDGPGTCDVCGMDLVPTESLGYLDLENLDMSAPLVIPASAPLITGKRALVYMADPENAGRFVGREIVLGPRAGSWYLVYEGLEEGDRVVVNGNFKIDSALQILARPSMMNPDGDGPAATGHAGHGEESHSSQQASAESEGEVYLEGIPEAFRSQLSKVFESYFTVHEGLSGDDLTIARSATESLLDDLAAVDMTILGHEAHQAWMESLKLLRSSADAVLAAKDIDASRAEFESMSTTLINVAERFGTGMDQPILVYHCPMAFDWKGADWLQKTEGTENPYFGAAMFKCGTKERELVSMPGAAGGTVHE
ncbi:efflux RND transporter periplasmic adaptor subunit [bacterium]|nr:efflux RND transporter periplasmic adaptor subunit [bacterium]